jgi:hypothetical protein
MMPYNARKRKTHAAYVKKRYREDLVYRAAHKAHVRDVKARNKVKVQKLIADFKSAGCQAPNCSEKERCCLTAHHLDPKKKEFSLFRAASTGISAKRVEAELVKCLCLCMNCHAKVHAGKIRIAGWSSLVAREPHKLESVVQIHPAQLRSIMFKYKCKSCQAEFNGGTELPPEITTDRDGSTKEFYFRCSNWTECGRRQGVSFDAQGGVINT